MRAYLARSETFVHNQLSTLRRYRPLVLCHHLRPQNEFSYQSGVSARDVLPRSLAFVDGLAYRVGRVTLPATSAALAEYTRSEEARLLHYHFLTDARFFLGIQRKTALPAIVSAYGYDVSSFPRAWKGMGLRYIRPVFDRADCILAMTEDMRDDLIALGCPSERVRVHYHGINTLRFRYPERDYCAAGVTTILSCGRFVPKKGHALLLHALRLIDRRGMRFKLVLVGDGPLRGDLERTVKSYDWAHCVTFSGQLPHMGSELVSHYHAADIFALPSQTAHGEKEGIPGTLVEAMASGLPVVSTQHAGIPAVIQPDVDGLLVPERDVRALADALDQLLTHTDLRAQLGRAAAARAADELDVKSRTAALEVIYDEFAG